MESPGLNDLQTKGQQLYAAGDYQGAAEQYRLWTDKMPTSADAWRMLGFAQLACQQLAESVESFQKACRLNPDNAENHFGLGVACSANNDLDLAVSSLDEAIRLKSDHVHAKKALVDALMRRAQVYISQNNFQYGDHDMDRAVKLDRRNPATILAYAKYLVDSGQQARAAKVVQQALNDLPTDSQILAAAQQLGVSSATAAVTEAQKKEQIRQSQETPCPACKKMVMNWASVCPHCNSVIRQIPGTFAGRDTGPSTTWQEVAYKVLCVIWMLFGILVIFGSLQIKNIKGYHEGMEAPGVIFGLVIIGVAVGLLTENETMQFIAKIFCYLVFVRLFFCGVLGGFATPFALAETLISMALAGFQLYLLKAVGGD